MYERDVGKYLSARSEFFTHYKKNWLKILMQTYIRENKDVNLINMDKFEYYQDIKDQSIKLMDNLKEKFKDSAEEKNEK